MAYYDEACSMSHCKPIAPFRLVSLRTFENGPEIVDQGEEEAGRW